MPTSARRSPSPDPDPAAWIADRPTDLWRFLRFLGCESSLAEDFAQETILAAFERGVPELDERAANAWLRRTARNLFVDHLRRAARHREVADVEQLEVAWDAHSSEHADYVAALRECLSCLDERERLAIELRYGERASRERIGAAIGLRSGGVKALLHRARRRLRACIERRLG